MESMAKRAKGYEEPKEEPTDQPDGEVDGGWESGLAVLSDLDALEADRPLSDRVEADLRAGGALSRSLPDYEERPAQITMARRVADALERDEHIIIEAGTGTGK